MQILCRVIHIRFSLLKGVDNGNADALSRLSVSESNTINFKVYDNFFINLITSNVKSITDLDMCEETKKDGVLRDIFLECFLVIDLLKARN